MAPSKLHFTRLTCFEITACVPLGTGSLFRRSISKVHRADMHHISASIRVRVRVRVVDFRNSGPKSAIVPQCL